MTKKIFCVKTTITTVVLAISCVGAWKAYDTYEENSNSFLGQNLEAISTTETSKSAVFCATQASPVVSIFPWYNGTAIICSNGYSPDKSTCERLQSPSCTSTSKYNVSGSSQTNYGYCIPLN